MTPPPFPRRILMTADAVGGVWNYALELGRALAPHGVEVALACMGPRPDAAQRRALAKCENISLHVTQARLEWMENPWDDVARAGEWLLELADRFQPEFVHLNGYAHATLPWSVPVLVVGHSCVLSWWSAVRGGDAPAEWDRYRDAVREGLHAADMVVAPTAAMLRELQRHYGVSGESAVIPNGRAAWDFHAAEKENFVLSVGRLWDEAKNARTLAEVAASLAWPVRLIGDGAGPDERRTAFANVQLTGRRAPDVVGAAYARAAIYALPARYEPFGLSVLEAALSGCALVLGDIPSLRENWDGAAQFVPPDDASALRATLTQLIEDATLRRDAAQRATIRARQFGPQRMAHAYLAAYARLTAGAAARLETILPA